MNSKDYVDNVLKTESIDFEKISERLSNQRVQRLLHVAMGLTTEGAEIMDMLKKHIFYGRELDLVNVAEELGDTCWYQGIGVDELGITFEDLFDGNISKLKLRYKDKFTETRAENRDLDLERELLENFYTPEDAEKRLSQSLSREERDTELYGTWTNSPSLYQRILTWIEEQVEDPTFPRPDFIIADLKLAIEQEQKSQDDWPQCSCLTGDAISDPACPRHGNVTVIGSKEQHIISSDNLYTFKGGPLDGMTVSKEAIEDAPEVFEQVNHKLREVVVKEDADIKNLPISTADATYAETFEDDE